MLEVRGIEKKACFIKGNNSVTFAPTEETWNAIGAVTGLILSSTVNAKIADGATVQIDYNTMTTADACVYVDELTGYAHANNGTVENNGTVTDALGETHPAYTVTVTPATADAKTKIHINKYVDPSILKG